MLLNSVEKMRNGDVPTLEIRVDEDLWQIAVPNGASQLQPCAKRKG